MDIITLILFLLSIGVYLLSIFAKKREIDLLSVVTSVVGLCAVLLDTSVDGTYQIMFVVISFLIILMSCLTWMGITKR